MYQTVTVYHCTRHKVRPETFHSRESLEAHLSQAHYLCSCGHWFVDIRAHMRHPSSRDHQIAESSIGHEGEPRQLRQWVPDPPAPPVVRPPHIAFRCWRVYPQLPMLMPLTGSNQATEWLPGREQIAASCREVTARRLEPHQVPHLGCTCGFWGLKDLWSAISRNPPFRGGIAFHYQQIDSDVVLDKHPDREHTPLLVAGAIEMYGLVTPGKNGWRSQFASILALWPVTNLARSAESQLQLSAALCDLYEVPVYEKWQDLVALVEGRRADYLLADALGPENLQARANLLEGRLRQALSQDTQADALKPAGSLPGRLTPDQVAFVERVTQRLGQGPALGEADLVELRQAAEVLGLAWNP